jgi:hypothetical protein
MPSLVILGAGPAGNTCPSVAATLGADVTLVESDIMGGRRPLGLHPLEGAHRDPQGATRPPPRSTRHAQSLPRHGLDSRAAPSTVASSDHICLRIADHLLTLSRHQSPTPPSRAVATADSAPAGVGVRGEPFDLRAGVTELPSQTRRGSCQCVCLRGPASQQSCAERIDDFAHMRPEHVAT